MVCNLSYGLIFYPYEGKQDRDSNPRHCSNRVDHYVCRCLRICRFIILRIYFLNERRAPRGQVNIFETHPFPLFHFLARQEEDANIVQNF